MVRVQIDAAKTNRSLTGQPPAKRRVVADPQLLFWRRLIDSAVADARRTFAGIPTDSAILARWWIQECRPSQDDRHEWERSFECACIWLNLNVDEERKRLLDDIDAWLRAAALEYVQAATYLRRAAVLACAGFPTAIQKAYVLPLVSDADYEQVAGIEHGDPPPRQMPMRMVAA